jgi:hypothetical protein
VSGDVAGRLPSDDRVQFKYWGVTGISGSRMDNVDVLSESERPLTEAPPRPDHR